MSKYLLLATLLFTACQTAPVVEDQKKFIDETLTGEIPFDYEIVETTAENGDYILAPSAFTFRQLFVSDPTTTKIIFHPAKMSKKAEGISEVEYLNGQKTQIANSLIIPLKTDKDTKLQTGDIILTWWQDENGSMTKAIIANAEETTAYYLSEAFGDEEKPLIPSSFSMLNEEIISPGRTIAIDRGNNSYQKGQIIHHDEENEKILAYTADEFLKVLTMEEFKLLELKPEIKTEQEDDEPQKIFAPVAGIYQEVEVVEFNQTTGLITCKYTWANQETIENFSITEITNSL